ncbi:arsenate-mycothiol transferase ArsC [Halopiger goleimassiliensis]|uniref:arsenate-mycothiol transferase ArsC n=1 Tax=Halopiger goleimassiliensis TaxID=1293048 RepID=UPI000677C40E|nr:low molecular weight phosphatase family protein [Halopiger goleimassiliensis]
MSESTHVAFVCVQNAGRSQMATAYAEREREARGLEDAVTIHSGGTQPADSVHDVVVEAMAEDGIDVSDREPRPIATETLESCSHVATMGCSTLELDADVDVRDWELPDPHGEDLETVREIRDDVKRRVQELFDELEN